MPRKTGDDYPPPFMDGWMAHKNDVERQRNPYDVRTQWASREAWTEGYVGRKYAIKQGENTDDLDNFQPRYML